MMTRSPFAWFSADGVGQEVQDGQPRAVGQALGLKTCFGEA